MYPSFIFQTYSELSLMEIDTLRKQGSVFCKDPVDLDTIRASFKSTNMLQYFLGHEEVLKRVIDAVSNAELKKDIHLSRDLPNVFYRQIHSQLTHPFFVRTCEGKEQTADLNHKQKRFLKKKVRKDTSFSLNLIQFALKAKLKAKEEN